MEAQSKSVTSNFVNVLESRLLDIKERLTAILSRQNEILINFRGDKRKVVGPQNENALMQEPTKCKKTILFTYLDSIGSTILDIENNTDEITDIL